MNTSMDFLFLERSVIRANLCVSCGTCIGICPPSVLRVNDIGEPELKGTCIGCGECVRFCPVLNFSFKEFRACQTMQEYDPFIGAYCNTLFGKTVDEEVWWRAAGGGVVSSMLISALEKGLISGAIVVKIDDKNPTIAKPFIARTRQDILSAAQSKYVPANVNSSLVELKKENGTFAMVGLPCQIQAIRMLQKKKPELFAEKIRYTIGLFCGYTLRASVMDYLLSSIGINVADIRHLWFRFKLDAEISALVIETNKGKTISIDKRMYNYLFYLFPKTGCLYCMDYTAEFSDVSVGDMRPLLKRTLNQQESKTFQSLIIVRTEKGMEILRNADRISTHKLHPHELILSKLTNMIDRKIRSHTRTNLRKAKGLQIPNYHSPLFGDYSFSQYAFAISTEKAYSPTTYVSEILWLKIVELTGNKLIVRILSRMPIALLSTILRRTIIRYKAKGFATSVPERTFPNEENPR